MTKHERPKHCAILVRHAKREVRWDKPEDQHRMAGWEYQPPNPMSSFDEKDEKGKNKDEKGKSGFTLTYALAGRLCDQLLADKSAIKKIIHGNHRVAEQTALVYKKVLETRQVNRRVIGDGGRIEVEVKDCDSLDPGRYSKEDMERIKADLESEDGDDRRPGRTVTFAYVLVGHQPALTTIARLWLQRRFRSALPFQTLPIEGSEAACLALGGNPRLLWLITNKQKPLMDDLKDKIKSKYDVAKFFLGAFVVNTGLILNAGVWDRIGPSGTPFGSTRRS